MQGRKRLTRIIEADHSSICFKPCKIKRHSLEQIQLLEDEMEALRLSDYEGLYQQECADKMGISRTTFSRLIISAHQKIADALLNTKALHVQRLSHKNSLK